MVKTSNLHKKLPILDAATGGKCPLYPTANPQSVAAGLTIKYKREALSRLEDLKTKQLANLDATEQRYHAAVKKVSWKKEILGCHSKKTLLLHCETEKAKLSKVKKKRKALVANKLSDETLPSETCFFSRI